MILHPWAIAIGVLAAGLPVLIHWLTRPRPVRFPLSTIRFRAKGSSGGQKGLADIIRRLGAEEFSRLRIGVGPLPPRWEPADFVLSKFGRSEGPIIEDVIGHAAEAVSLWMEQGIDACMNQFN